MAGVRLILDGVVAALRADPHKRFVYCEMAFFSRWWRQQGASTQAAVRALVAEGRLSFANGGWVMHDEAASHYADMITQTARGHRFLSDQFGAGALPTVGWQLDPFGHSALQATLMGAELGFGAVFLGRADYDDLAGRRATRRLELGWAPSGSAPGARTLAMVLGSGNYGPPPGFDWDVNSGGEAPPVVDDPAMGAEFNVHGRVDAFVDAAQEWATLFQGAGPGGDVMFTMGSDFHYQATALAPPPAPALRAPRPAPRRRRPPVGRRLTFGLTTWTV